MLKSLASMLMKKPADPAPQTPAAPAPSHDAPKLVKDENTPIYQSLAMTEEMREALFPTTPQMVSAIFERRQAQNPTAAPAATLAVQSARSEDGASPIV